MQKCSIPGAVGGYWCSHKRTGTNLAAGSFPSTPAFNPWDCRFLELYYNLKKISFFTGQCSAAWDNESITCNWLSNNHFSVTDTN